MRCAQIEKRAVISVQILLGRAAIKGSWTAAAAATELLELAEVRDTCARRALDVAAAHACPPSFSSKRFCRWVT